MKRCCALAVMLCVFVGGLAQEANQEPNKKIFLPKSPRAAAYMLKRQSNEDLVRIIRSEPVYIALLERAGLELRWRQEALKGLAGLHGTDPMTELVDSIVRVSLSKEKDASVLRDQSRMLLGFPVEELQASHDAITKLALSDEDTTSQIGLAALVAITGDASNVAGAHPKKIANLLHATELLDASRRSSMFSIAQANWPHASDSTRHAAVLAASVIPGREEITLSHLQATIAAHKDVDIALSALGKIPIPKWSTSLQELIADTLVSLVEETDVAQRTTGNAKSAAELAQQLAGSLPSAQGKEIQSRLDGLSVLQIEVIAALETMMFEPDVLVVPANRAIEIVFKNEDDKPHNFLLAEPGKLEDVGLAAQAMATTPEGQAKHYVPDSGVLHASTMLMAEKTERINFQSPVKPGVYPYVCTFPGHWVRMFGAMVVVDDVAGYLAKHQEVPSADELLGKKIVQAWTYEDLAADAAKLADASRSFENGRRLFAKVSCVACHKIAKEGLLTGNIGPDLSEISKKHKTPGALLREIVEPSFSIEEKYASVVVIDYNGISIRGVVVDRTDTELILKENPLVNCEPKVIKLEDIEDEQKSEISPMPEGLLNTLYKEEILDLLAFIYSGGDASHSLFQ